MYYIIQRSKNFETKKSNMYSFETRLFSCKSLIDLYRETTGYKSVDDYKIKRGIPKDDEVIIFDDLSNEIKDFDEFSSRYQNAIEVYENDEKRNNFADQIIKGALNDIEERNILYEFLKKEKEYFSKIDEKNDYILNRIKAIDEAIIEVKSLYNGGKTNLNSVYNYIKTYIYYKFTHFIKFYKFHVDHMALGDMEDVNLEVYVNQDELPLNEHSFDGLEDEEMETMIDDFAFSRGWSEDEIMRYKNNLHEKSKRI